MIRLLNESDRAEAVALLEKSPAQNLYLLGNIASLGFDKDFSQFWGEFGPDNQLRGLLNRYMNGWVIYGKADADWAAMAQLLDEYPEKAERLQDNPGGIPSFLPYLKAYTVEALHVEELMQLENDQFVPARGMVAAGAALIRRGTIEDLANLTAFYADAGEMARSAAGVEQPLSRTRLWLAEEDGEILSAALTNAETDKLAMIGGVYTRPVARGRGLSQLLCSALCAELIAEGKMPVLYWINPIAGSIYRKLGFQRIGEWRSVRLQPRKA